MSDESGSFDFYLIGGGRVGLTFARALSTQRRLAGVWTRSEASANRLRDETGASVDHGTIPELPSNTVCVVAVPDRAIAAILSSHPQREEEDRVFLHVSGSAGCDVFADAGVRGAAGVAHPLHSFPKNGAAEADLVGVVMGTMGDPEALDAASQLAGLLGMRALELPRDSAVAYHLAATVASNGVYALLNVASSILALAGIDDEHIVRGMARLASQSAESAFESGVVSAATGPVVRGDASTVQNHRRWLSEHRSKAGVVYRVLSDWLVDVARKQGVRESLIQAVESVLADESP